MLPSAEASATRRFAVQRHATFGVLEGMTGTQDSAVKVHPRVLTSRNDESVCAICSFTLDT